MTNMFNVDDVEEDGEAYVAIDAKKYDRNKKTIALLEDSDDDKEFKPTQRASKAPNKGLASMFAGDDITSGFGAKEKKAPEPKKMPALPAIGGGKSKPKPQEEF